MHTTNFAEECKRLCYCNDRENGTKGCNKYKKREAEYKVNYVQNKNDVMITNLKKGNWNEKW